MGKTTKIKDLIPDNKNMTYIYSLSCPFTNDIRYIGKSNNPKNRFNRHIKNAKDGKTFHCPTWIRSILKLNNIPILNIIEKCAIENWKEKETYWISFYLNKGYDLTNCKNGGDGIGILKEETRQKMSIAKIGTAHHLGFKNSEESKKAMSLAAIAKFKRPESEKLKNIIRENQKKAAAKNRGLTEAQVINIKNLFKKGLRIGLISKQTNVNISVLEKIKQGKNYAWVKL
jgi:hypothetical protein